MIICYVSFVCEQIFCWITFVELERATGKGENADLHRIIPQNQLYDQEDYSEPRWPTTVPAESSGGTQQ